MSTPRKRKKKTARAKAAPARAKKKAPSKEVAIPAGPRRAVFIDVENTSNEAELIRVLDELKIDPQHAVTQLWAIGNWRTVGQHMGRSLAERGAVLVHSAPAARVRDWSDLWIAVHAGIWLGRARAGDVIEIVSHDRAFDAVGDAAAQLGVLFRRITYRAGAASAAAAAEPREAQGERRGSRRRRGGRRGRGGREGFVPSRPAQPTPAAVAVESSHATPEAVHGATPQQLLETIARLTRDSGTTTLDALTIALKAAGFHRPPGSPRLVTRLRQLKTVEVLPNGRLRLREGAAIEAADEAPASDAPAHDVGDATPSDPPRRSRRRRRGGRGRGAAQAQTNEPGEPS
jgi:hypothetical protein